MSDVQKFLRELGQSLSDFLGQELPRITGTGWWERSVLSVLTSMQLENVERRQITGLTGLDLAALLRVLDQNWHAISRNKSLPWEVRNFIKETYSIRNRWVHAATHPAPKEDTYRDLDTMQRLAQALGDSPLAERLGRAKRDLLPGNPNARTPGSLHSIKSRSGELRDATSDGIAARNAIPEQQQDPVEAHEGSASRVDLVLVGCVKTKLQGRHKAKDLFVSPLFIGRRARAEALGAPWFVLSAKFGLLSPDCEVETYDVSLNAASSAERRAWSARVLEQLRERFGSVAGKTVEVHAGASYRKFGLVQGLRSEGARVIIPLEHARQGEQLAWYGDQARKAPRDVPPFARNITPKVQLVPPLVRSQSSGPAVELLSAKPIPPFSYRWPENVEEFSTGWEMQVRHGEQVHHVRYGIGGRVCYGRYRVHTVVFLNGHPMVEGAEAEDYSVTGDLVSVLKVSGGNRDAKSLEEVDPDYAIFRVERHCDAIEGRNARRGLAVRIGRDDLQSWAHHALLRARAKGAVVSSRRGRPKVVAVESATEVDAGTRKRVAEGLLEFGRRLAAGKPTSFTPDAQADAFVRSDPFAFLVAVICDEQVRFEAAWEAPLRLKERLGHWDIRRIADEKDSVRAAFSASPALHRWVSVSADRVVAAAARVISRYRGDASLIWSGEPSAGELRERFELFEGIGQKKSAMAVEILERELCVPLQRLDGSDVAVDVHVRRVFLRSGLAERDDVHHIVAAARTANPDHPGALDLPAWEIGRTWCRPRAPDCAGCPIGAVCPRLIDRAAAVRGS
jgi:uncharacterized HhH-GPD family protein